MRLPVYLIVYLIANMNSGRKEGEIQQSWKCLVDLSFNFKPARIWWRSGTRKQRAFRSILHQEKIQLRALLEWTQCRCDSLGSEVNRLVSVHAGNELSQEARETRAGGGVEAKRPNYSTERMHLLPRNE